MSKKIDVGVIGLGRLGRLYASYFLGRISGARLVAVSDLQEDLARLFAEEHNIPRYYKHHQELIADEAVQAVVIVAPTSAHREISIEAAGRGKAVFCEKPLSLSIEDCLAIKAEVDRTGVFYQLGFMRRFDKGYLAAKKKIDEGLIGKPIVFKSTSRDPFRPSLEFLDPKHSGGLLTDCGIHDMDLARWLVGEVDSVYSIGDVLAYPEMKPLGDVDNAVTTLRFENGALGVIDVSRSGVYGYDIRTEILGTAGTLQIGYLRETPLTVLTRDGVTHDTVPYFMERFGQAYTDQLQNFIDNLLTQTPSQVTCDDGVAALEISLAATRSLLEKRPVFVDGRR
jgi:scyllo-inositol 2-dehydrogenase (NAD+)